MCRDTTRDRKERWHFGWLLFPFIPSGSQGSPPHIQGRSPFLNQPSLVNTFMNTTMGAPPQLLGDFRNCTWNGGVRLFTVALWDKMKGWERKIWRQGQERFSGKTPAGTTISRLEQKGIWGEFWLYSECSEKFLECLSGESLLGWAMWNCHFYNKIRGTKAISNSSTLFVANSTFSIAVYMRDSVYSAGTEHIVFSKKMSSKSQITFKIKLVICQNQVKLSVWKVTLSTYCQRGCVS